MKYSRLIALIEENINNKIDVKNSWGKNEVKTVVKSALIESVTTVLDHQNQKEA